MSQHRSEQEAELRSLEERESDLEIVRSYLRTRVMARRVFDAVPGAEALVLNYPKDLDDDIKSTIFEPQTQPRWIDEDFDERYFDAVLTADTVIRELPMIAELKRSFSPADWGHYIGNLRTLARNISDVDTLELIGWPAVLTLDDGEKAYDRYLVEEEVFVKPYRTHRDDVVLDLGVFLHLQGESIARAFAGFEVQHSAAMQLDPDANLDELERVLATVDEEIARLESNVAVIHTLMISAAVRADHPGAVSLTVGRAHRRLGEVYLMAITFDDGRYLDFGEHEDECYFDDCYTYWRGALLAVEVPGHYAGERKLYSGPTGQELTMVRSIPLEEAVIRSTANQSDAARH